MQITWCAVIVGALLAGCAAQPRAGGFAVSHTLANTTAVKITVAQSRTDHGEELPFQGVVMPSNNPYSGVTGGGLGRHAGLPEWIVLSWRETGPEWELSNQQYQALDAGARQARLAAYRALPLKSARIAVGSRIPATVLQELKQSPLDPDRANLPLKSLRMYFIWTPEGVKMRWQVLEKCCKVLHEGGDALG